jgi:PAS domain-containing protein
VNHENNSAERRVERTDAADRGPSVRARFGTAVAKLGADTLSDIGLGPALGLLAAALIVVSSVALGGAITLALLPLVLGVAILVALVAMRREQAGNVRLAALADRLDQSLESLKDLQWEVREREARYRDLLDHQGDVILRRDADQRLSFVNDAFSRTFGLSRDAALGQIFHLPVTSAEQDDPAGWQKDGEERRSRNVELRAGSCGKTSSSATPTAACKRCKASAATSPSSARRSFNSPRPAIRRWRRARPNRGSSPR